jgi:hypothetical protein
VEADELARLDAQAAPPVRALNYDRPPPGGSLATPHAFVCSDGRTYWLKRSAQDGLIAELAAGRIGAQVGAAPNANPVDLPSHALPVSGVANHLLGLCVGIADEPGMENFKDIAATVAGGQLDESRLDPAAVARVIAFQTWVGADDTQILVELRSGKLLSIDHGQLKALNALNTPPQIVIATGIAGTVGREPRFMRPAVERIEQVTDEDLLRAVARAPNDAQWNAPPDRRLALAQSLRLRRDALRETLKQWMH